MQFICQTHRVYVAWDLSILDFYLSLGLSVLGFIILGFICVGVYLSQGLSTPWSINTGVCLSFGWSMLNTCLFVGQSHSACLDLQLDKYNIFILNQNLTVVLYP